MPMMTQQDTGKPYELLDSPDQENQQRRAQDHSVRDHFQQRLRRLCEQLQQQTGQQQRPRYQSDGQLQRRELTEGGRLWHYSLSTLETRSRSSRLIRARCPTPSPSSSPDQDLHFHGQVQRGGELLHSRPRHQRTGEPSSTATSSRYGRPLFGSVEDERFPLPVIIPQCLTGEDIDTVTFDNFGKQVKLYLHERRVE